MSEDQPYPVRPYEQWAIEPNQHWIDAGNTFGAHLMHYVRDNAVRRAMSLTQSNEQQIRQIIDIALNDVMDLLDGYFRPDIDDRHRAEYVLLMRICDTEHQVVETVELAPDGDGLALGYAGWRQGDFGQGRH